MPKRKPEQGKIGWDGKSRDISISDEAGRRRVLRGGRKEEHGARTRQLECCGIVKRKKKEGSREQRKTKKKN